MEVKINDAESRKAVNFDLDTKLLKQVYPNKNYRNAYNDIKNFMLKNGFIHKQWSGYATIEPTSEAAILEIVEKLKETYAWINSGVVKSFDVTEIGKTYSLSHTFAQPEKPALKIRIKKHKGSEKSMEEWKQEIERKRESSKDSKEGRKERRPSFKKIEQREN